MLSPSFYSCSFLDQFVLVLVFLVQDFYLDLDRQSKAFLEEADQVKLSESSFEVKLLQYALQLFQMRGPVLNIFKLILRVPSKHILDTIYKSPRTAEIFAKKDFNFVLGYRNVQPYHKYVPMLILSLASIDVFLKEKSCKQNIIIINRIGYLKMILVFLAELIVIQV